MKFPYMACVVCGEGVHVKSKKCKCGAPSPWPEKDSAAVEHPKLDAPVLQYMVTKRFVLSEPVTMVFPQGKIINDPVMIGRLLNGGAPITPVVDTEALCSCPECKHVFLRG